MRFLIFFGFSCCSAFAPNSLDAVVNEQLEGEAVDGFNADEGYKPGTVYVTVPRSQNQWLKDMFNSWGLPGDLAQGLWLEEKYLKF